MVSFRTLGVSANLHLYSWDPFSSLPGSSNSQVPIWGWLRGPSVWGLDLKGAVPC